MALSGAGPITTEELAGLGIAEDYLRVWVSSTLPRSCLAHFFFAPTSFFLAAVSRGSVASVNQPLGYVQKKYLYRLNLACPRLVRPSDVDRRCVGPNSATNMSTTLEAALADDMRIDVSQVFSFGSARMPIVAVALVAKCPVHL